MRIEGELYGASTGRLLERLRNEPDEHEAVMLIRHNPAMLDWAASLSPDAGQRLGKFPTGVRASLTFAGSWAAVAPGQAELVPFVKTRDLG
jgi:phosphohistidine phosphatase